MARRAAESLAAAGRACVVLPPIAYSVAQYASPFAGTLSLRPETAVALLTDALVAAARAGLQPLAVANAHLEPAHIETIKPGRRGPRAPPAPTRASPTSRAAPSRSASPRSSAAAPATPADMRGSLVLADDPSAVKDELRRALPAVPISLVDAMRAGRKDFREAGGAQAYFGQPAEASARGGPSDIRGPGADPGRSAPRSRL